MTFDQPWFLLALLALPILWLLSRIRRQRREVPVPSLVVWRTLGLEAEPPRETMRRSDLLLLLRLAAAALLVLGTAGLRIAGDRGEPVLHVVRDVSPSMGAFDAEAESALARIRDAAPDGARTSVHRSEGLRDLPAVLARAGAGSVVLVTDHAPAELPGDGRVRLALVGRPVENRGFISAWVRDEENGPRFGAVVRNFGASAATLVVRHPGGSTPLELAPGESGVVRGPAPEGGAELSLVPGDLFAFDDRVVVLRQEAEPLRLRWAGPGEKRLRLALEVSGVQFDDGASDALAYRTAPDESTRIAVAPPGTSRAVRGLLASAGDLSVHAVPAPGLTLGRAAKLAPGGTVLLADAAGPLAVHRDGRVEVALDPGDPASEWARSPAFPIFWSEVVRRLGGRGERSMIEQGRIEPAESATRPTGGPLDLSGLVPSREEGSGTGLAPLLCLAAAGLIAATVILGRGRRRAKEG